jgi:hypothetical protein
MSPSNDGQPTCLSREDLPFNNDDKEDARYVSLPSQQSRDPSSSVPMV